MKTLEELLKEMNDAAAAMAAAPLDKALQFAAAEAKKAYDDAKALVDAGNGGGEGDNGGGSSDEFDEKTADEKTKAYIKKLRDENAKHRTAGKSVKDQLAAEVLKRKAILKAAGIEEESEAPEEKIKSLSGTLQQQSFRSAVLEKALELGIAHDQVKYFQFLIGEAAEQLEEGEELSDEKLLEISVQVKKVANGGKPANTSVHGDGKGGKAPAPGGGDKAVSLDQFCRMSITEKSKLFETNRDLYESLWAEAKSKRKAV